MENITKAIGFVVALFALICCLFKLYDALMQVQYILSMIYFALACFAGLVVGALIESRE